MAAIHAALIAWAWQRAVPPVTRPAPLRVAMRLVMPSAAAPVAAPAPRPAVARKPVRRQPLPTRQVPAAEPVTGIAFAPPTIALPGSSAPARWMNPPPAPMPPPPSGQMVHAQAAHESIRAQLAAALQRELGQWQPLSAEGHCRLDVEREASLACDNESLLEMLAPREGVLAALLASYRSLEPRAHGLTIALVQGRYQANWD
ncbi:MAG TPA: hypothetical protein VF169_13400 [Albitalea sp.]|uniref:hypothetical protein n=1 Tax=Piscinibacter sp. TaxID=1903157 RepID=UPI002ED0793F